MPDLKDELEQERREKEWAETWKPDGPGDMLIGTLEGYDEATTDFGTYTVAHIRNEEGVLKGLWLMHSVLQDEWEEAAPEVGERVGAMYHGKRSGDNFDYHMWTVKVDRSATKEDRSEAQTKSRPEEASRPETAATGNDPAPQDSGAGGFDGSDLYGPPAIESESEGDPASQETGSGSDGPTLDDPNSELPF